MITPDSGRARTARLSLVPACLLAVVATAATFWFRFAIDDALGGRPTLIIFTLPVMASAYAGGLWPGLLAMALSYFGASYYLLAPLHSFAVASAVDSFQQRFLVLAGILISLGKEALHRARRIADRATLNHERAETALRASEERYRMLFECAPDGILIANANSTYLDANPSMCRMLGYTRDELVGRHASDIVADTEVEHIGPALTAITAHTGYHREWRFRRGDATTFEAEVIAAQMPDGNLLATVRDVTDRKRSEARFRRLVESNAQGVIFWNTKGEITGANDAFLDLVGYSRDDMKREPLKWATMTPPEYAHLDDVALADLAATGMTVPFEKEFFRKDGSRVPVLVGAAIFDDSPDEGVCFVLDMTARREAEAALRDSEETFSVAFRSSPVALAISSLEGVYVEVNETFCAVSGYSRDEVIGKTSIQLGLTTEAARDALRGAMERMGGTLHDFELTVPVRDGGFRDLLYSIAPLQLHGKEFRLATSIDISQRKRAEDAVREASVELSRMNRALKMLSACNEMLIRATDEDALLQSICHIAVAIGGYRIAGVGFAIDDERKSVDIKALAGDMTDLLRDPSFSWSADVAEGQSGVGRAIRSGEIVVIPSLAEEPSLARMVPQIRAGRLGGGVYMPLSDGTRVMGVLVLYSAEGVQVSEDELTLLRELAADLAFGICTIRDRAEKRHADAALLSSLGEKNVLLKEVHHRVKNNMQVISSLLRLEARRIDHPATKSVLNDMQNRIHAMAALHEILYRSTSFAQVDLADYLRKLTSQLRHSLAGGPSRVEFDLDMASVALDLDQAIPCGLILNEIVSNCLKHAFPNERHGKVTIQLESMPDGLVRLRVSDDGIGLPVDISLRMGRSLGLQLVADLTKQLSGTLQVGPGSSFEVSFRPTIRELPAGAAA